MSFLLNYQQKHEKLSPAWWGCSQKSAQKGKGKKKRGMRAEGKGIRLKNTLNLKISPANLTGYCQPFPLCNLHVIEF